MNSWLWTAHLPGPFGENPAATAPTVPLESRFWIPELPLFHRAYWHQQNLASRPWYLRHGRAAGLASARSATRGER